MPPYPLCAVCLIDLRLANCCTEARNTYYCTITVRMHILCKSRTVTLDCIYICTLKLYCKHSVSIAINKRVITQLWNIQHKFHSQMKYIHSYILNPTVHTYCKCRTANEYISTHKTLIDKLTCRMPPKYSR